MNKHRYQVKAGRGGKSDRFYVWDLVEKRVHKGKLQKSEAIELEHQLNGRGFLSKKIKPYARPGGV